MKWRIVDLTQDIFNGMPVYPGHQRTVVYPAKTHEETSYAYRNSPSGHTSTTNVLLMSDHGPQFLRSEFLVDRGGQQQDGTDPAEDAG